MTKSIQLITSETDSSKYPHINIATFVSPRSLDEFDINIIDLSNEELWFYSEKSPTSINQANDLRSLREMVERRHSSKIIYILPQNIHFHYHKISSPVSYIHSTLLKDNLLFLPKILNLVIPNMFNVEVTFSGPYFKLHYENTCTEVGSRSFNAAFHFSGVLHPYHAKTESVKSEKITTICTRNYIYLTTLDITSNEEDIFTFIQALFPEEKEQQPEWFSEVSFGDDIQQRAVINEQTQVIENANKAIANAQAKLDENNRYKSILYTQGEELSRVVVSILESMLQCDLSAFEDKKYEDFLIQKESVTFIGEIKGVSSNVKNDNIGQIEHHCQQYNDLLEESGREENVRALLIINPFRSKNPADREPVHERQIELAKRNGCLIIETATLLRVFEDYQQGIITTAKCIEVFSSHTGLLSISDFD